ncbi:MAG: hypothetical protein PHP89_01930 [Candidatus Omnitrophica bacterium]|jgi:rubrerythrin|nr:hypothetical protein [Candidatus Omnitrophota bacterium]MDD3987568.1 hypothetical protein [Candidatus Omnitrophota bacterium]MDD5665000.1 hypothetical protein [Candidatus Omnitrophota bacterium]
MMNPEEYMDLNIKLVIALFVSLGWAVILYPLMRRLKRSWPFLLVAVALLSLSLFILKEVMDQVTPFGDELAAYLLGIFFALAILSALFNFKNKLLYITAAVNYLFKPVQDTVNVNSLKSARNEDSFVKAPKKIHLRQLLEAGILIEEKGREFYNRLAEKSTDQKVKDLCFSLSREEVEHKIFMEKILYKWLPLPLTAEALRLIEEEMKRWGIYLNPPGIDATEEDMAKYAIDQEVKMANFYLSFEKSFPQAWKRMNIRLLVTAERSHADKLINAYPSLSK